MFTNYNVTISDFAQKHYIKNFIKKYKSKQWIVTEKAIVEELRRFDALCAENVQHLEKIHSDKNRHICKLDFKVAGTKESKKTSGYRIILFADCEKRFIEILLVYSKADIKGKHETVWWEKEVEKNHPTSKIW